MNNPTHPNRSLVQRLWLGASSLLVAGAACLTQTAHATSPLPFYEPFPSSYGDNTQLGAGATTAIWDVGNSATSSSSRVALVAGIIYPGLIVDTNSNREGIRSRFKGNQGSGTKNRGATLSIPASTTLYASFLICIQTNNDPGFTAPFFGLSTSTSTTSISANGATVHLDSLGRLLISKNTASPGVTTPYSLGTNVIHLVVLRYQFNSANTNDDSVDLWLDPGGLGNNATMPAPLISTTNASDLTSAFTCVGWFANNPTSGTGGGDFFVDEIRVSTNWADVTPVTTPPGTVFAVTGGGFACNAVFPVGLTGSETACSYLLYSNGVFTGNTVAGTGSPITFGSVSSGIYTVLATNNTTSAVGWMSSSAKVANFAPPSITTQPIGTTVANGGLGVISVVAAGDGLTYQWRRNGANISDAGHYSGTTTPNLMISSVDAGDVATSGNGYDVVINGTCSPSVTSTRVALSTKTAANLVWRGDVTNLWDVGISTDWTNGTSAAAFGFGDNVTFDDTATSANVVLYSPFLSPGTITLNNSLINYTFAIGGNIIGPVAITKNGTATLTINGANSFTGGVVVNSGVVSFINNYAFGTGPITLAGGNLIAGNAILSPGNPIVVTADSVVGTRNTASGALTFTNTFSGTGGTLTVTNATTSGSATIVLSNPNNNFSRPVVLAPNPISGKGILLSFQNTSGTEIFSGNISGGNSFAAYAATPTAPIEHRASGGSIVLSGNNIYTGGTLLQDGGIGVGSGAALGVDPLILGTSTASKSLFAYGGAQTVTNDVVYATSGAEGAATTISGTNDLTLSGTIDLAGYDHTFQINNTAKTIFSGNVVNGGSFTKTGTGTLYLNGSSSCNTFVNGGALGGNGTNNADVTVASAATLAPGFNVSALTISGNLNLSGNMLIEVNKSVPARNDSVSVGGTASNTGTGTVTVVNLGSSLQVGDRFVLLNQALGNGNTMTVTGGGAQWTNNLAVDGSITVTSVMPSTGTNIIFSVNNGSLGLSWPVNYTGWELQCQTNGLDSTKWVTIPGSTAVHQMSFPIGANNGSVFYRMHHP